ncbi:MAG TPA: DNA polymerase III subunit delta [bacterium]|nr:DNA polymerase III subunit delta [bacterium]
MTDTRKKNIILFTGPNRVVRERALSAWIAAFERKYGAEQIVRLDVSAAPADALRAEISAMGLFASTKLVVLSGWSMAKSESTEHDGDDQKTEASSSAGTILLDFAERIPESTFVVVHAPSLDRRSKLAKFLEKSCTVKSYEAPTERDVFSFVQENFEIEPAATRLLIDRFADDLDGAARLLELLALYRADGMITVEDVRQHAPPRAAENIFPLVDALLSGDHTLAADTLVGLLVRESPYALLASLVSNLRTAVLIGRLSQE